MGQLTTYQLTCAILIAWTTAQPVPASTTVANFLLTLYLEISYGTLPLIHTLTDADMERRVSYALYPSYKGLHLF